MPDLKGKIPEDDVKDFIRRVKKGVGDKSASGAVRLAGTENFKIKYDPDLPVRARFRFIALWNSGVSLGASRNPAWPMYSEMIASRSWRTGISRDFPPFSAKCSIHWAPA